MKPIVLLVTSSRWIPTARLAMAMANAGFTVDAVCPPAHPMSLTGATRKLHHYSGLTPVSSISSAIVAVHPDLLIPCDDLATRQLHELYARELGRGTQGANVCGLLEKSLGAPSSYSIVYERTPFIEMASAAGVLVPRTALIETTVNLQDWITRVGLPTVLKSNGTSGGEGVRIAQTEAEATAAFKKLQAPPRLAQGIKRALLDHDNTLIWPALMRSRSVVNVQEFVEGREATSLIASWNGEVLASLNFEVVHKLHAAGPATVLRLTDNRDMAMATATMTRKLNLSGLHGFDFMIETATEKAFLIEINPRTTQVGHLALGPGRDLPAALFSAVTGEPVRPAPKLTEKDTIALFPGEWTRNPTSKYLQSAYHDVPWVAPQLIRAGAAKQKKQSPLYTQKEEAEAVPETTPTRS